MSTKSLGRIALVDDEENIRETVAYALRREGYHVDLYADGHEAWERLQGGLPDVAVLDIVMPRMDGYEVLNYLRNNPPARHLPIIVLSASDDTRKIA